MLALALVLEGSSREEAARAAGMERQTLGDWVHRYNAEGLPGLRDRGAGRASRPSRRPSWRRPWSVALIRTATAWCAGAGWTCEP
jgi:transposase